MSGQEAERTSRRQNQSDGVSRASRRSQQPIHRRGAQELRSPRADRPPVVVEHEGRRKDTETYVMSDHAQLREEVAPPWPFGKAESDGVWPVSACDKDGQHDPRCGEACVENPPAPQQRWPRTAALRKHSVPQQHDERSHHHGFLAGHAQSAGHDGSRNPSATTTPRSNTAVQRQEQSTGPSATRPVGRDR